MTPAQVMLSWAVQRGTSVVPKTVKEDRLKENFTLSKLSEEHFDVVNTITDEMESIRFLDPSRHTGFDIFDETKDEPVSNSAPWDD